MSSYFIVDHISNPEKTEGIVESYQMVNVEIDEDGTTTSSSKRINFVHWPNLPAPFVHEEWSDELVFSNIYTPELDVGYDLADDEDEDEEGVEFYQETDDTEENLNLVDL